MLVQIKGLSHNNRNFVFTILEQKPTIASMKQVVIAPEAFAAKAIAAAEWVAAEKDSRGVLVHAPGVSKQPLWASALWKRMIKVGLLDRSDAAALFESVSYLLDHTTEMIPEEVKETVATVESKADESNVNEDDPRYQWLTTIVGVNPKWIYVDEKGRYAAKRTSKKQRNAMEPWDDMVESIEGTSGYVVTVGVEEAAIFLDI